MNVSTMQNATTMLANVTAALPATNPPGLVNGGNPFNSALSLFLLQAFLVMALAKVIGMVISRLNEPAVIAEMLAGIVLGPSVLGLIPGWSATLFPPASIAALSMVAQWGLVLFMFVVGLQQDIDMFNKSARRAFLTAVIGVAVPLAAAVPFAIVTNDPTYNGTNLGLYIVFVGLLVGVSALPVLARIVTEFDFLATPLGVFTMSATAFDDLIAWPVLAAVTALATSRATLSVLWIVISLVCEALLLWFGVRPLLRFMAARAGARKFSEPLAVAVLLVLVAVTFVSELIGVTALVGAYICGCLVPRQGPTVAALLDRIEWIVTNAFVPLYFATSGLRTQLNLLNSAELWGLTAFLVATACVGKMSGCVLSARFIGRLSWLDSGLFGILMNTKGLVALVTANIGLDAQIITRELFAMSIVMILVNTLMTGPLVNGIYRWVRKSSFVGDNRSARLGAPVNIVVAVGKQDAAAAAATVRVSSLLYGERQDRSALHLWRIVDGDEPLPPAAPFRTSRFAALGFGGRADAATAASTAAGRDAGVKVKVKSHISDAVLPDELCRIATAANAGSIVIAVPAIAALATPPIVALVQAARCDVVAVVAPQHAQPQARAPQPQRIVVVHCGGAHDDLALDIAVGAASEERAVLVCKLVVAADPDDNERSLADHSTVQHFLARAMAGTHVDVVWRASVPALASRVLAESDVGVVLLGFDSPVLPLLAALAHSVPIAVANSAVAEIRATVALPAPHDELVETKRRRRRRTKRSRQSLE